MCCGPICSTTFVGSICHLLLEYEPLQTKQTQLPENFRTMIKKHILRFTGSRTEIRILKLVNYKVSLDDEQGIMVKICVSVLDDDKATIIKIVILCAHATVVREIMLAAEELNMIDSGEYVFFSTELYSSFKYISSAPWFVKNDTHERNIRAKKAYSALLIVTPKMPNNEKYKNFSIDVKKLAEEKYNYSFGNESVSPYVTAFYDAVLLYSLALNETIRLGGNPSNGTLISTRMLNKQFEGITGSVTVGHDGVRITDFSLLDLDPETNEFKIVAHYISVNKSLNYVPGGRIYWAGGRTEPPPDIPECGFDGALCTKTANPMMFWALICLGFSAIVASMVISLVTYRTTCFSAF
ncbi:hypothetical protein PGB90_000244 [Kerria lacca]